MNFPWSETNWNSMVELLFCSMLPADCLIRHWRLKVIERKRVESKSIEYFSTVSVEVAIHDLDFFTLVRREMINSVRTSASGEN